MLRIGVVSLSVLLCGSLAISASAQEPKSAVPTNGDSIHVLLYKSGVQYAYPRWSRDGTQILFESNETGKWQICVINADGTGLKRITNDQYNNSFPDWSPDSRQIAFVSDRGGDEDIYVQNMDGSGLKNLSNYPARDIHPYWAPDGKSILFNSLRDNPQDFEVYQINVDGTGFKRLTNTRDTETCARFSPDMSRVVLLRAYNSANDEVFLMTPDGKQQSNLTNSQAAEGWPVWHPDGIHIIYSSDPTGTFCLYEMSADDSGMKQITHVKGPWYDARASVSPDGKKLAFNRQLDQSIALVTMPLPGFGKN